MWLPETGLYHYKARAYNPELGRFMQTDPIGVNGRMNIYAYVGGDPGNFTGKPGQTQFPRSYAVILGRSAVSWSGSSPGAASLP